MRLATGAAAFHAPNEHGRGEPLAAGGIVEEDHLNGEAGWLRVEYTLKNTSESDAA